MIVGVSCGLGLAIDPLYISEIAPQHRRGALVSWSELAINVGILLGFAAAVLLQPLPVHRAWRAMLASGLDGRKWEQADQRFIRRDGVDWRDDLDAPRGAGGKGRPRTGEHHRHPRRS